MCLLYAGAPGDPGIPGLMGPAGLIGPKGELTKHKCLSIFMFK